MGLVELLQQIEIGENQDFEFKSRGLGLPQDMWETVSAFANTEGSCIVLRVTQQKKKLLIIGVSNIQGKLKAFWDQHNNPQKPSTQICSISDVEVVEVVSLIPENVAKELKKIVGEHYRDLIEWERIVLVAAHRFEMISNRVIQKYRKEHPEDCY